MQEIVYIEVLPLLDTENLRASLEYDEVYGYTQSHGTDAALLRELASFRERLCPALH